MDSITRAVDPALRAKAIPLREWFLTPTVRTTLLVLLAAVGLVLLVACANVTNLLLARNAARAREHTVRVALGATRRRLLMESLAYSGAIAVCGAAVGALLATVIVRGLIALEPAGIPRLDAVRVDYPILIFAALLAGLSTVVVAAMPAFQSLRTAAVLRTTSTNAPAGRNIRRALVVAEVAVSVVLLVGASLLGRSLVRLLQTDIGVTSEPVTAALIDVSYGRRLSMIEQRQLIDRVVERVSRLPGITSIGAGAAMPPNLARLRFTMPRFDDASGTQTNYMVDAVTATPGYFTTLGMRLRSGRLFQDSDAPGSPEAMIVSSSTARQLFGPRDPIGRVVQLPTLTPDGLKPAPVTVVGVIDDVKYSGIDTPANAVIYRPFSQQPWPSMYIVMRTADGASELAASLRREIATVDPGIGVQTIDTLDGLVANAVAQPRFRAMVLIGLAVLAITLAAIGLQRRRVVHGGSAHHRDWHSHGRRRRSGRRDPSGAARGSVDGRRRHCHRRGCRACTDRRDCQPALRGSTDRSRFVRWRRSALDGTDDRRELCPRSPGEPDRSARRAPAGMIGWASSDDRQLRRDIDRPIDGTVDRTFLLEHLVSALRGHDFVGRDTLQGEDDVDAAKHEDAVLNFDVAVGRGCQQIAAGSDLARLQRASKGPEQSTARRGDHVVQCCRMRIGTSPVTP